MDLIEIIRDNKNRDIRLLRNSKVDTDFTLFTSNGLLDVNRKVLQAFSPVIKNIPDTRKRIEVFDADVEDLRAIVDYCVRGKCLVPQSRLHLVCDLSERLEFDDFHKKVQKIISGQKELSAACSLTECVNLSGDDESQMTTEFDEICELPQKTFKAKEPPKLNDNTDANPAKMTMTAQGKCMPAIACGIKSDSRNVQGCSNKKPRKSITKSDDVPLPAFQMDLDCNGSLNNAKPNECNEEPVFGFKVCRNGVKCFKWTDIVTKLFLGVWLKSTKDPKIDMREELAKQGLLLSVQNLRSRKSSYRKKYKAHIRGTEQADIKPYLNLIKEILDAEESSTEKPRFVAVWTKDMIDVLLNIWAKYARRGLHNGSWDVIESEIVDELAQMNLQVTHTQVTDKKWKLLQMYREHEKGKIQTSILPYLPLLDEIHNLTQK